MQFKKRKNFVCGKNPIFLPIGLFVFLCLPGTHLGIRASCILEKNTRKIIPGTLQPEL